MDVVYILKPSEVNEELRYSLRSMDANFEFNQVWFVGYKPRWVDGNEIKVVQKSNKYANSTHNLLTACKNEAISDDFVLMNDDFFFLQNMTEIPALHRGSVDDVIEDYIERKKEGRYISGARETQRLCRSFTRRPMSYELHVPMVINKSRFIRMFDIFKRHPKPEHLHKRTLYGNLYRIGGRQMDDCKIIANDECIDFSLPFVSTSDASFRSGLVGRQLKKMFKERSRFE